MALLPPAPRLVLESWPLVTMVAVVTSLSTTTAINTLRVNILGGINILWSTVNCSIAPKLSPTLSTKTDTLLPCGGHNSQNNNTRDFCLYSHDRVNTQLAFKH